MKLTFTDNLPTGVTEGTTKETTVSITDDDVPSVTVEYGSATYSVEERRRHDTTEDKENEVTVTVKLSADPERTVTIPIDQDRPGRGLERRLLGGPGQRHLQLRGHLQDLHLHGDGDTVDDDGESVKLTFGSTLPAGVTEGTTK